MGFNNSRHKDRCSMCSAVLSYTNFCEIRRWEEVKSWPRGQKFSEELLFGAAMRPNWPSWVSQRAHRSLGRLNQPAEKRWFLLPAHRWRQLPIHSPTTHPWLVFPSWDAKEGGDEQRQEGKRKTAEVKHQNCKEEFIMIIFKRSHAKFFPLRKVFEVSIQGYWACA